MILYTKVSIYYKAYVALKPRAVVQLGVAGT